MISRNKYTGSLQILWNVLLPFNSRAHGSFCCERSFDISFEWLTPRTYPMGNGMMAVIHILNGVHETLVAMFTCFVCRNDFTLKWNNLSSGFLTISGNCKTPWFRTCLRLQCLTIQFTNFMPRAKMNKAILRNSFVLPEFIVLVFRTVNKFRFPRPQIHNPLR